MKFPTVCKALVRELGQSNIWPYKAVLSGRKGEREVARKRVCNDSTRVTSVLLHRNVCGLSVVRFIKA